MKSAVLFSPILFANAVITGFNTDIEYQGVTYHVQTEDKGVDTPMILSLVYDRGAILASKRSPYDDLIVEGFDEKALAERLQKQHKLICAAVRAGRIEDLKRMTMKESALKQTKLIARKEVNPAVETKKIESQEAESSVETKKKAIPTPQFFEEDSPSLQSTQDDRIEPPAPPENLEAKIPKPTGEAVWDIPVNVVEEQIIEAVQIIEEETILPADAVEIIADSKKIENPLDNKLKIELLTDMNFQGGERKTVNIMARRGADEKGLSGAHILIKIVGSNFRPLIFHSKTDSNGIAAIHLHLPHFKGGRAAILIKAMSEGEEAELRRIITQG